MAAQLIHQVFGETDTGQVLLLSLSNPGFRNALHPDIYAQGLATFQALTLSSNPAYVNVRAVVINGADDFFCAGGNLNRLKENRSKDKQVQRDSIGLLNSFILAVRNCPLPIIAAVSGAAAGAGFSLAMACDMLVADPQAKFVMAYVKIGLSPDGGATYSLSRQLPAQLAFELSALGESIDAQRLYQLGVVNRLSPETGQATSVALALAARLATGPKRALSDIKKLLSLHEQTQLVKSLEAEREAFTDNLHSVDAGIGIDAFLNKQTPRFT